MFYPWSDLDIPWSSIQTRYIATYTNLGPYGAEFYLYGDVKRRIMQLIRDSPSEVRGRAYPSVSRTQAVRQQMAPILSEIEAIISDFRLFFEDGSSPARIPLSISLEWCSPKIRVLVDILVEYRSPTFQGIVFVEQRQIATCLAQLLPCIPQIKDFILCAELIGQGNSDDGLAKGMGLKDQHDAVKLFRNKKINLRESVLHHLSV